MFREPLLLNFMQWAWLYGGLRRAGMGFAAVGGEVSLERWDVNAELV